MTLFDWSPRVASPSFGIDVPIDNSVAFSSNQESYSSIYSPTSNFTDSRQLTINVNSPNAITKKADKTTPSGSTNPINLEQDTTAEQEGARPNFKLPDFNLIGGANGLLLIGAIGFGAYLLLRKKSD